MPTRWALLGLLLHSGCVTEPPEAPSVQLVMWPGQAHLAAYDDAARSWEPLGFTLASDSDTECPRLWYSEPRITDCTITVGIKREPMLVEREGTAAYANRAERFIVIDSSLEGYDLAVAATHELGHVLLDTAEHTEGGVMGGSSTSLEPVDYELACRSVGICI